MGKNIKGGKNRKRGKNSNEESNKRELETKGRGTEYAEVIKMLGSGRVTANCFDGKERLCTIRGSMRKRTWIGVGDIILIGLREYQDDKADIMVRYNEDEKNQLIADGEFANDKLSASRINNDEIAFDFNAI